jgi:nicotinate-nucleotide adenylyltransferase
MNLGIFGGTFNPIHVGHLIVVETVRDQLHLDRVLLVPSASPPHKQDVALAPRADRLEMTRLAVLDNPAYEVSPVEIEREGPSYSVDTLTALSEMYPRANLSLIIGADNFIEFGTWKSPQEILAKAELVVMSRPGFLIPEHKSEYSRSARFVLVPPIGISGSEIRRRVKMGRSIRYMVPKVVEDFIRHKGLYR